MDRRGPLALSLLIAASLAGPVIESGFASEVPTRVAPASDAEFSDPRNIESGLPIPDQGYCDQPYVVVTDRGHWLCCLTTGPGHEGAGGQHVVCTTSRDQGKSWGPLIDIEPSGQIEASWGIPLVTPSGRIYAFYDYNGDRAGHGLDRFAIDGRTRYRADMLGWYCYRYSDDHGATWSDRYRLPVRETACDRANQFGGRVQIFWGIDKPKIDEGTVRFAFTKLGRYMLDDGEGWLFSSDNLLVEPDPKRIRWRMLPEGEHGIRADEFGSVQEEHNMVPLGGGRLYMVYRTTQGFPCESYSPDGGRTWSKPEPMRYAPAGRIVRNPRACPKLWKCENGKYLFWFHNHGGTSFQDRNPAWIAGGVERDGKLHWSEPEILLYADDPAVRMSYPDLIEQDGRRWVTETQKTIARVHEIDPGLLRGLWGQFDAEQEVARSGLVFTKRATDRDTATAAILKSLDVSISGGVSVDLWFDSTGLEAGDTLLDSRDAEGAGIRVEMTEDKTLRLTVSDGENRAAWETDRGALDADGLHHVAAIVDAGPRIVLFVVDGRVCDGRGERQFGWGRFQRSLGDVRGGRIHVDPRVQRVRVYDRPLRTSEAVGNFRAGPDLGPGTRSGIK